MAKKFGLMDFGEDKAKHLAEIMGNKTSQKILNHLKEKEASESDIANDLDLPVSTVHYNIQKLIKNELIEVKDFYWSDKGNKVNIYKPTDKMFILTPKKSKRLENKLKVIIPLTVVIALLVVINVVNFNPDQQSFAGQQSYPVLQRFASGEDLIKAFEKSGRSGAPMLEGVMYSSADSSVSQESAQYSETNVQVEGVDEADIVKTDGKYIYTLAQNKLIIAEAFPEDNAKILTTLELAEFRPRELFIHEDKLLIFGSENYNFERDNFESVSEEDYYPRYMNFMSVKLYDISNKENPDLIRSVDFGGNYLTSRKIQSDVYFVVNSYPHYRDSVVCNDIIPLYRENSETPTSIADCTEIGYIEPMQASNFITIASISMTDKNKEIEKEVIVGNGQNVYASLNNLYIAQTSWSNGRVGELREDETTAITKFNLDNGEIKFAGAGEVKGHILNQFSMDEHDSNFRIATTSGNVWGSTSRNNIYILDKDLDLIGSLEDLAPGERIYSVRFMGEKGYVVTFKKVDPLFVIDLSNARNPSVLGKLKIPGYSDYLHPYDENHIIGIGKETVEAEEDLKNSRNLDFVWYQGVKMAIFDVSDVNNPIELHKVVIGDRGTNSDALHDHKAFLFDREKNLLVLPITLAEIKGEKTRDNQHGDFVFQGAYVYDITLEDGFDLKGRITHYEDDEDFKKSGYYFSGNSAVKRSLYIGNVLYTISNTKIKLNSLRDLEELKELVF